MRDSLKNASRIVVKFGTGVLTDSRKQPDWPAGCSLDFNGIGRFREIVGRLSDDHFTVVLST